jgi:hypothetical protein
MTDDHSFQANYLEGVSKFHALRTRAFLHEILSLLRGQSAELMSFEDVRTRLRLREESYKGLQDIPVDSIAGSVGRHKEFTKTFLPRSNETKERWSRVYAKMNSMEGVPPIEVYKIGEVYFVRDGNHRVSVARENGARTIQAHVTELPTSVLVTPEMTLEDIDQAAAYISFLDATHLRHTRPHHQSMQLSDASGYNSLLGHIFLHGQILERQRGAPVSTADAAADWYDNIYRPAVTLIRKHDVMKLTGEERNHTEADLYVWMVDHLLDIRRQYGQDASARKFSHALVDYLAEKKIPIPRELLKEEDDSVILTHTQIVKAISDEGYSKYVADDQS